MKNKTQIAADMLAVYILCLPLVLAFHAQTHVHHTAIIDIDNPANITVEGNSDCQICNFYFDQQLYVQSVFILPLDSFSYCFHQNITEILFTTAREQLHLRGPPQV